MGLSLWLALGSCALQSGCQNAAKPASSSAPAPAEGPSTTISEAARAEALAIFGTRCAVCHGQTGAGDGAASAALTPKPRNFHDSSWQASVNDEYIQKIIAYGGLAVGKSAAMPPNPDLSEKSDVLAALRERVRSFGH